MNKHLEPVFRILLHGIEKTGFNYWVYGGVSVAAYAGKFFRSNKDVDIFVRDNEFERIRLILQKLCDQNNFELIQEGEKSKRPKIEIKINGYKKFSMIPICQKDNIVVFLYEKRYGGDQEYPNQILERVERDIFGYRFFTPQDGFIKEMFINHIKARPDKKNRDNFKIDAKAILNSGDFAKLNWVL